MSQSVLPVDYATPVDKRQRDPVHVAGVLAVALIVGSVGANPLAAAVGFDPINDVRTEPGEVLLHIICGALVAFAAGSAIVIIYRALHELRRHLGAQVHRPRFAASVLMMSFGVFCMILPLVLPYFPVSNYASPNFLGVLLSMFIFIAGAILLGIGVWANLQPAPNESNDPLARSAGITSSSR